MKGIPSFCYEESGEQPEIIINQNHREAKTLTGEINFAFYVYLKQLSNICSVTRSCGGGRDGSLWEAGNTKWELALAHS